MNRFSSAHAPGSQIDDGTGAGDGGTVDGATAPRRDRMPVEFVIHSGHTVSGEEPEPTEAEGALGQFLNQDPRIPDDVRVRVAPPGKRASGPALILELLDISTESREAETWLPAVERVAAAWRLVRHKLPDDQLPVLSLGTLQLLCMGDLLHRLGSVESIRLLWSGQVAGDDSRDDEELLERLFSVIFARDSQLWSYLVDARGRIVDFSGSRRV